MKSPNPLQRSAFAAGVLALACTSALAGEGLASLVYAGGEALAPEQEARVVAWLTTPGGSVTRDEVRLQLADAQRDGALAEAGEIAETQRVLLARHTANERQLHQILAAREAERVRLAALEAEAAAAEARRQAQALAQATPAAPVDASTAPAPAEPVPGATPAATAVAPAEGEATATPAPTAPADEPADRPIDRPAAAPPEVPITRPSDVQAQPLIDKD